jgi:hypothetical protein
VNVKPSRIILLKTKTPEVVARQKLTEGIGEYEENLRAEAIFEVKLPPYRHPSWVEPDFCLHVLDTDKNGALVLLYGQSRLVLVEQRGLGWVTSRRE